MTVLPLMHSWWLRALRAHRRRTDGTALVEHVDSALLDSSGFRASDSIGLDGAPSMVFDDAMPPYSHELDRPSVRSS